MSADTEPASALLQTEVETYRPADIEPGTKVRAVRSVRNDGTYPGLPRGAFLINEGDVGYVQSVGEFLQRYYIYAVDFYERGRLVGMRRFEIEPEAGSARGGPE